MTARNRWFAVLLVALFCAGMGLAQPKKKGEDTARTVQGTVSDAAGNPVVGAVVQLKNTKNLQIRSFITKDKGDFYFNGLSPDVDFELKADMNGSSSPTRTLSAFDGRKQAVINLKLSK